MALIFKTDNHIPKDCIECRNNIGATIVRCHAFCKLVEKAYRDMKIDIGERKRFEPEKSVDELIAEYGRPKDCIILGEIADEMVEGWINSLKK